MSSGIVPRRRAMLSLHQRFLRILLVIAVFYSEMNFAGGARRRPKWMLRALRKPAVEKPVLVAEEGEEGEGKVERAVTLASNQWKKDLKPYQRNFFPKNLYKEFGGLYENPVFIFEGHPSKLTLFCAPPDAKEPKNKQMYDWRFTDGRAVFVNFRFGLDAKRGTMKIENPDADTDGYYKCNIIMPDESIIAFRHTVMTVTFPIYKIFYSIYVAVRKKCDDPSSGQVMDAEDASNRRTLCPDPKNCRYEFQIEKGQSTIVLNETTGNVDSCMGRFNFILRARPTQVRKNDCGSLHCMRKDFQDKFTRGVAALPSAINDQYKARYQALAEKNEITSTTLVPVNFTERFLGICPSGYRTHDLTVCVPCEPGTQAKLKSDNSEEYYCEKCPEEMFNSKFHQFKCEKCPKDRVVNSESTTCFDPKTAFGMADTDLKKLIDRSEEVDKNLVDEKGWSKRKAKEWLSKQLEKKPVKIGIIVTVNVLVVVIAVVILWKRYKKPAKYSALGKVEGNAGMQKLVFKAAAEVYRKKEIVDEMGAKQKKLYDKMTDPQKLQYINNAFKQEQLLQRLQVIKSKTLGGLPDSPGK